MEKKEYEVILKYKDYTIIKYQKKYIGDEYVVARKFDPDNFCWESGGKYQYAYSEEQALAFLLYKLGNEYLKSENQVKVENKTGISFERMTEMLSASVQNLDENGLEYFDYDAELTDAEKDFVGYNLRKEELEVEDED